ncbi:autotransporter domain-containing protein [Methylocella tundrae]|nr:autotransporter outer membrane beta-barrel domain-containing protein [Methylocella tundrae]
MRDLLFRRNAAIEPRPATAGGGRRRIAMVMRIGLIAGGPAIGLASGAKAQTMTFEGLKDGELVNAYYNGGSGSLGSQGGPAKNYGVAWVGALAGFAPNGTFNNVANEPTSPTVMGFLSGPAPVMNVANGFTKGFSFAYAAPFFTGSITVWSGLNGTGTELATLTLPTNGSNPNFSESYSNWTPIGVGFSGIAESVTFGGTANFIVFDDVTINSINPGGSTINTTQPFFLASALGATVSPVFQGGTLRMDQINGIYAQNFTLNNSATNTIDEAGNVSTFTGVFSDAAPGTPGNLIIANSGAGGSATFTGVNTYTGTTTINAGATLIIGPGGSIDNLSTITNSGVLDVAAGGAITVAGITNNTTGVITNFGAITDALDNSGVVINAAAYNADVNNFATGAIVNSGVWTGDLLSNTGSIINSGTWNSANFSNNAGGVVNTAGVLTATAALVNAGLFNAQGSLTTPLVNNTGVFNVTGPLAGAIGTFNNAGTLSLVNGSTTDTFAATTYNGQGGRFAIDVNPTSTAATQRADLLKVTNLSGSTSLFINAVGGSGLIRTPIPVIAATTVAPGTSVSVGNNPGIINYGLQQAGGTYNLISTVNTSVASATPTGINAVVSALNTGFFQNASAFISEPPDPSRNQWNGGPWIRVADGQNDVSSLTSAQNPTGTASAPAKVRANFNGFQTGVDLGVANVEGSGWNTHLGVTAGQVNLRTNDLVTTNISSQVQVPFIGIYGAVTGHNFFADFQVREDFYEMNLYNPGAFLTGSNLAGTALAVNASAGYRFDLPSSWFVEPSVAFMYSDLHLDSLRVGLDSSGMSSAYLNFNPFLSDLGRAGVRVGTTYISDALQLALQPFVTGSVWREFAGDTHTTFVTQGASVPLSVTRIGTFGQVGVGVSAQVLKTGVLGFLRGDYRFGDSISGYALVAGLRYQF